MDGSPLWLNMRVHDKIANAYWDGEQMTFGDGSSEFYPLVSLGIVAHEVSHGFTHQHAGLVGGGQAGGLNEAFSDMAAQALEFYTNKHSTWKIGADVVKAPKLALRYMDEPTKDCPANHLPGVSCSINSMKQYYGKLDVHLSCGIFNKLFYLLATSPDWDVKKAFDVMVHANMHYWTYNTTFIEASCGVISSAKDLKYDITAVNKAILGVGINPATCVASPAIAQPIITKPTTPAPQPKPAPTPDDDDDVTKAEVSTPWGV
jgi:pseudolysin